MARTEKCAILIHVDDMLFVGRKSFWNVFLQEMGQQLQVAHEQLDGVGTSITFLRRKITEVEDGLILSPGATVEKVVKLYEKHFGSVRQQKAPCDSSIQLPDNSEKLNSQDSSAFRSVVGLCFYISRERPDLMFAIKELASVMSSPTVTPLGHLRKLIGFMKQLGDAGVRLHVPFPGSGKFSAGGEKNWILESYSDADWISNRSHRRSTSCGMHFWNGSFCYGSSRNQKVVSLSSCESELHSMVSCMSDASFIRACCEFILNEHIQQVQYTDSSSARQLACRQGAGRIRHLSGKVLWVQEKAQDGSVDLRQVPTAENISDIATKVLTRQRLLYLMHETGLVFLPSFDDVGEEEFARHQAKERGNFVLWNAKTRAENTDPPAADEDEEESEEELPTDDEEHGSPDGPMTILLEHMRADQNIALAGEYFNDANNIQQVIITLLDASAGPNPEGLSTEVVQRIRGVFQPLQRYHRNRGLDERAARFQVYVEDMERLMRR
eukprot:s2135_g25.t1